MSRVIANPDAIGPEWLTQALFESGHLLQGRVVRVRATTELSYTSTIARLTLIHSDDARPTAPTRLFLKLSRPDAKQRVVGSRQRWYEVKFHTQVAPSMPEPPVVRCYQAVYCPETGTSHLLFDDVSASHFAGQSWLPRHLHQAEKTSEQIVPVFAHSP
jgi:hypothetical protein